MLSEPAALIVAKAKAEGSASIQLQPALDVTVRVRQPLLVRFVYNLEETSNHRETWRFEMRSMVGAQHPAPAQVEWKDRWGVHDSLWGMLQNEYRFERPGNYEGSFDVLAKYDETGWIAHHALRHVEQTVDGTFRVHVLPERRKVGS